jgi:hypothetical protein
MRERYLLFETEERRWAQRVLQALDPERRSSIMVVLVKLALTNLLKRNFLLC